MRGWSFASVGWFVVLVSITQAAPQTGKTVATPPALCTVSGQVVTAAEGSPLKSSRVTLLRQDSGPSPLAFAANTDSEGRFEIRKVVPGKYLFVASHTGYIAQQYKAKGVGGGALLGLAPGQEINDGLFRLVRAAAVTGRIVDENGEPMVRLMVTALRKLTAEEKEDWGPRAKREELRPSHAAMTDDRGLYRIYGLKPGEYYLKAAESDMPESFGLSPEDDNMSWIVRDTLGRQYAPAFYPGVLQVDQAQPVVLGPGEEVDADFSVRHVKTIEIVGRVIAGDGKPAIHATVQMYAAEGWDEGTSTISGASGEFSIKGVAPGSYVVSVYQTDQDGHHMTHMTRQKLEVGNENIDSLVIAFGKGTTIAGRITFATAGANALDRIRIQLEPNSDSDTAGVEFADVRRDGSFELTEVPEGDYVLRAEGMRQGWYMRSARFAGDDVLQKGVEVERGSSSGTLDIVLSSASAQLDVAVTENDKPAPGAQVRAKPDPETPYNRINSTIATTDQNGHFTFTGMPPGKYRITAKLSSVSPEIPETASEPSTVTLGEHEHQSVQLTLTPPSQ